VLAGSTLRSIRSSTSLERGKEGGREGGREREEGEAKAVFESMQREGREKRIKEKSAKAR
jgi:hypothetical protein